VQSRVNGWWVFAAILLTISGILNLVWGIGAVSDSKFYVKDAQYIVSGLHTWGWVTVVIGVIQLIGALSLFGGGGLGRFVGILAAGLSAIAALMSIPASPFWSLCVFALAIIVLFELAKPRDIIEV
jgi:hypothetical protein